MNNKTKTSIICEKQYPTIFKMDQEFRDRYRFASNLIPNGIKNFGNPWLTQFERTAKALIRKEEDITAAIRGYASFAMNSMRLQAEFDNTHKYRAKTYEQASNEVYNNEDYMMEEYLPGLLLSHFLWPHHYRQLQFFESAFLSGIQLTIEPSFIEVGIGTGLYSALLMHAKTDASGVGVDISPFSINFTKNLLAELGLGNRYDCELRDINSTDPHAERPSWLICVEVLEHLEDPVGFLRSLRRNLAPNGKAFITAAINAAHSDHIYLYRNSKEVCDHLSEAGFTIEQYYVGKAYQAGKIGSQVPEAAAFIAY